MLIRRETVVKDALWRLAKPSFHPSKTISVCKNFSTFYSLLTFIMVT